MTDDIDDTNSGQTPFNAAAGDDNNANNGGKKPARKKKADKKTDTPKNDGADDGLQGKIIITKNKRGGKWTPMTDEMSRDAEGDTGEDTSAKPAAKPVPAKPKVDPNIAQRQASDPLASVWVTASAGTGKTKVLTDRVLRLMLQGATPDQILCITFTRAAAALMTNRIREELAKWAVMEDAELTRKLEFLTGDKPDAPTLTRARRLFGDFLDSHGGMGIQTIHSFSQSLLKRFPIESGIPPYFTVMDDQSAVQMLREAQAEVLQDVEDNPDTPLARAVRMITPEISEDDFDNLIGQITYRRGQLLSNIDSHGGLGGTIQKIYDYVGAEEGVEAKKVLAQLLSNEAIEEVHGDIYALRNAADWIPHVVRGDDAYVFQETLRNFIDATPEKRVEMLPEYKKIFFTTKGDIRKKIPDISSVLADEALRLQEGLDHVASANVARGTESILRLTLAILEKYTAKKRAMNVLDFDDLVFRANVMMQQDNAAGWVLEKLPGQLKHILVDEAQDTNPDQWQLVAAIVSEFFTGKTRHQSTDNTLFVVGDEKQSIFSFQRADPQEFAARKKFFSELVKNNGGTWRNVDMEVTFRSTAAITQAVDAVFAEEDAADGLYFVDEGERKQVNHISFREGQAGRVEIMPAIRINDKTHPMPWELPVNRQPLRDIASELAERIADHIQTLIESGEKLESRDRKINPSDIMILVRRRSSFVDRIVRALQKRDIPVAGADRMSLREQIVVMDLMALGECLLFAKDDYKLACVLKSPLIGMDDQQLEDLAVGRKATLWEALEAKAAEEKAPVIYKKTFEYLSNLRAEMNAERPYEFYSSVLMNPCPAHDKSAQAAIYGRLGAEAEDPLVEFLNAVERFEEQHVPSLQGFIAWITAGEAEVKREISLKPETPKVNIMTVHGAKGLEAPIVIMADTMGVPSENLQARPRFLWPTEGRDIPLWCPRADLENRIFKNERHLAELEQDREYRRLMYVAMTRAADRLYVFGAKSGDREPPVDCWYNMIWRGIQGNLGREIQEIKTLYKLSDAEKEMIAQLKIRLGIAADEEGKSDIESQIKALENLEREQTILRFDVAQTAKPQPDYTPQDIQHEKTTAVPSWARAAAKPDTPPAERFRPSVYAAENGMEKKPAAADTFYDNDNIDPVDEQAVGRVPSPLDDVGETYFAQLGTVIHELFEFLPSLPAAERAPAAEKYLAKPAWGITPEDQKDTLKRIITILEHPKFGAIFGANSRPEVSLTGVFDINGKPHMMDAKIDRLVVDDKTVMIVDFKNTRGVPKSADRVNEKFIVQMASYRHALQKIYPDRDVQCALLYTRGAKLIPIPAAMLDAAVARIGLDAPAPAAPDVKGPAAI